MKKIVMLICACFVMLSLHGCSDGPLKPQEMLEDYDTMWLSIESNYAQMNMAQRKTGKDFQTIKETYRNKITSKTTPMQFDAIISQCIAEFDNVGRMSKLDENTYTETLQKLEDNSLSSPHSEYLYDAINTRNAKAWYDYPYKGDDSGNKTRINLTTSVLMANHIVYLRMDTMNAKYIEKDMEKIEKFLKKYKDFDSCIIDLRGVSDGDDSYWRENLVPMNIKKNMSYTTYELVKPGDESIEYLSTEYKLKDISKLILPTVNSGDIIDMTSFIKVKHVVPTEKGKTLFKGNFYVLIDNKTAGTAEKFAQFAKQSGFATLVGENTSGDSFGIDPLLVLLPNSGMVIQFNATNALNPDGTSNEEKGTEPDIVAGKNVNALQKAIEEIQKTLPPEEPQSEENNQVPQA